MCIVGKNEVGVTPTTSADVSMDLTTLAVEVLLPDMGIDASRCLTNYLNKATTKTAIFE